MILYFDCYITDIPFGRPKPVKDNFRSKNKIYSFNTRFNISKYSLASYAIFPWSNVLIKYQLDDSKEAVEFESYARSLFPKAIIIGNRSATQAEYRKSIEILDKMADEFIFYAPNNDHPLLLSNEEQIEYFKKLEKKAIELHKTYKNVAIAYSHFSEYINVTNPKSIIFDHFCKETTVLHEDEDAIIALEPRGEFNSCVVVSKDLFYIWFNSVEFGEQRIARAEDVAGKVKVIDEVLIIPKNQLAAHYDSYEHTLGGKLEIRLDQVPSLFVPPGFFENNIRIAYGYEKNREGWVNINPQAEKYSFRDPENGTDLKIGLQDIPLFWKSRIKEIDINKAVDVKKLEQARKRNLEIVYNPYSLKNQGLNLQTLKFRLKRILLVLYPILNKFGLIPFANKIRSKLGFY